ncbi:tyrosine-protein phosphatase [Raoultibacter phocaeensis]|uniref:tyrosine-protein phosphatase n=1 Tax=Raoultibacter phocaeensis TaxID=2479841 RepID=UPI0015D63210|nr:tyrosine-protein phosphatase [Raoultibacter phocaeensis]
MDLIPTMQGIALEEDALPDGAVVDGDGHIELEGLANTRDLGGIKTEDGRAVLPKMLIRSGALSGATEHDAAALTDEYRLAKVIDLRTEEERLKNPDPEDLFDGVEFLDIPILNTQALGITREGGIKGLLKAVKVIDTDPAGLMIDIYPSMLLNEQSMQGYRRFFEELLKNEPPIGTDPIDDDSELSPATGSVLWHCSAGKDRAGLATVLLLHVLGVPYESILADYLATNKYMETRTQEILDSLSAYGMAGKLDEGVRVLNSADERFLRAALDAVNERYGNLDAYLEEALGITPEKADALRAKFLGK